MPKPLPDPVSDERVIGEFMRVAQEFTSGCFIVAFGTCVDDPSKSGGPIIVKYIPDEKTRFALHATVLDFVGDAGGILEDMGTCDCDNDED